MVCTVLYLGEPPSELPLLLIRAMMSDVDIDGNDDNDKDATDDDDDYLRRTARQVRTRKKVREETVISSLCCTW